jgi:Tol biopolymer transport system component
MINSEGKNEWEPINPTKIPTDWNAIGFPFDPAVEFIKSPTFVDSGKKIAFTTLGHSGIVFTINSTDGKELKLWNANYEGGYGKVRGGSGSSLLLTEGQPATGVAEVEILDAAGAQPQLTARQGTKLGGVKAGFSAVLPAWSPDGKQIVFVKSTELNKAGPVKGTLVLVTLDGKDVKETTELTTGTFSAVSWAR